MQTAYSHERGRKGQGQACPASPKLTNQINRCSSPGSEGLPGEKLRALHLHTSLHMEGNCRIGEEVSSQECQTVLGMNKASSDPGRNPQVSVLIH